MKISYLITLIEVVKSKSYSIAAKNLYITQPAITKHIKILEKAYEINIFKRENGQIELTSEGEKLYAYALNVQRLDESLKSNLANDGIDVKGELKILTSYIPGSVYLTKIIPQFQKKNKMVKPHILISDTSIVIKKVKSGEIPFGLIGKKYEDSQVACTKVFENDMVIVAPKIYEGQAVDENLLSKLQIVTREKGSATRETFINHLVEKGISKNRIQTAIYCNNNDALIKMLYTGDYLTYVSKNLVENNSRVAILETTLKRKFYFIENTNRYLSSAELAFKNFICNR